VGDAGKAPAGLIGVQDRTLAGALAKVLIVLPQPGGQVAPGLRQPEGLTLTLDRTDSMAARLSTLTPTR